MKSKTLNSKTYEFRFGETGLVFRNKMWKIVCNLFLSRFFNKEDCVLDIPCGYGEFINNIDVKKKFAVDINEDSAKYVQSNVIYKRGKSEKIPFGKSSMNKIFVSNFFEHITREQIVKTVIEFSRILKKNGQVIVLQPNIRYCEKDYWMFFDHITPIDDRALDEVFKLHGFKCTSKILKFLPYTTKTKLPKFTLLLEIYLRLPFIWKFFGQQSLIVYEKV